MTELTVAVVEDEPVTREALLESMAGVAGLRLLWEAANGVEAVRRCRDARPDVLFLDVQMPEMSGFEVLTSLSGDEMPGAVVFVTAYDRYAVRAFDVHAVDYILKPFDDERLERAVERARARLAERSRGRGPDADELLEVVRGLGDHLRHLERIPVRTSDRIVFVDVDDVDWIEADGNYVRLHAGAREHLARRGLKDLEIRLDDRRFARVHRSTIVNLSRVRELLPLPAGDARLRMDDGTELRVSRTYREAFERRMEGRTPLNG